jgi:uncharacterized spore protein YtfJ
LWRNGSSRGDDDARGDNLMEQQATTHTAPIEQMLAKLSAETVFGKPTTEGDVMIIPVAQAEYGFGYGGGYGRSPNGESASDEQGQTATQAAEGGGSGGGAGGRVIPRGYVRISPQEVKFEPITDETRIPLAGILLVAWIVFWVMATIRTIAKAVARRKRATA